MEKKPAFFETYMTGAEAAEALAAAADALRDMTADRDRWRERAERWERRWRESVYGPGGGR